jgi:hypothetical protein
MKPLLLTIEPTESEIQHAAFLRWVEEGRPAGRDLEIWLAAKERLRHALPRHGADGRRISAAGHEPEAALAQVGVDSALL